MPTYSQVEPNDTWIQKDEEVEDALMVDVDFTLVIELDVLEEEGY